MSLSTNSIYVASVSKVVDSDLPWYLFQDTSVLISGATGLIGSFLCDVLMKKNADGMNCTVYALGRNEYKAKERFAKWWDDSHFNFIPYDINRSLVSKDIAKVEYVIHLASNTHPFQYATQPIETITTNIIGLQNMLDFSIAHEARRVAFASSVEVYGENRGDVERFDESYCGYLDCNTLRAGYPESKRCGEALCQAYIRQKNLDVVIPRFARVYGPTMSISDSRAISQFICKAVNGEDIILKSDGIQYYSFIYVADAVRGLLSVLLKGECGEAYNIADVNSDITLKDLAALIAHYAGKRVVFELPDETEKAGFSKATKARLDSQKIQNLGWKASYSISTGIKETLEILQDDN